MSIGNIWNMLGILTTKWRERQWQEFLSLILWSKHCMIFWLIDSLCLRALSFSICLMYSLSLCWICESEICSRFQWQYQGQATRQVKLKRCEYQSSCPVPCAKSILHIFGLNLDQTLCCTLPPIQTNCHYKMDQKVNTDASSGLKNLGRQPQNVAKLWAIPPRSIKGLLKSIPSTPRNGHQLLSRAGSNSWYSLFLISEKQNKYHVWFWGDMTPQHTHTHTW